MLEYNPTNIHSYYVHSLNQTLFSKKWFIVHRIGVTFIGHIFSYGFNQCESCIICSFATVAMYVQLMNMETNDAHKMPLVCELC